MTIDPTSNLCSAADHIICPSRRKRDSTKAAAAAARAQALERSGRAKRGRAAAGRAFVLYLAGSASGRQNQKWKDISLLPEENKKFILNLIDMALRDFKVKKAHNS